MGQNQKTVWGADGSLNALTYDPERLTIVTDPDHPLYDERVNLPIDDAMVRNIMVNGILQPIVIALDPETSAILVVAGRQRVRCAIEANRRLRERGEATIRVPAMPRKGEGAALAVVVVSENEIRQADGPLVKARKMRHLENLGHSIDDIATAFGVNALTVSNHLALIDCGKAVQKAIEGQYIGISDVKYLSRLTPSQQTEKVAELVRVTAGKEGHARAKAKRAVLATAAAPGAKPAAPKMKGRKEITAMIEEIKAERCDMTSVQLLEWVLGHELGGLIEPEKDTKTGELFGAAA